MIRRFKNISIGHKLLIIYGIACFVVLSLSAVVLTVSTWLNARDAAQVELESIAKLIGANSTAALVFNDTGAAQEILETLRTNPDVMLGVLFNPAGEELSRYQEPGFEPVSRALIDDTETTLIDGMQVTVYRPITLDGQAVGSILLQSTLHSRLAHLQGTILPLLGMLLVTFAIAMAIALVLARSITLPIRHLSDLMVRISREDNFQLRARLNQKDEIGVLAEGVNGMLARIEQRDAEIGAHRHHLEEQVEKRTAELRDANLRVKTELEELARAEKELKQAHQELELQHTNSSLLSEMNDRLQVCHAIEDISPVVTHYLHRLLPEGGGGLYLFDRTRSLVESVVTWGEMASVDAVFAQEECWALRQGRLHVVEDPESGLLCPHCSNGSAQAYVCAPMIAYGELIGVLHLSATETSSISGATRQVILSAAEHLAVAIANLRLREALHMKSVRDPLTDLFNRRYLQETLERELARTNRNGHSTAVLMIDIDHFKGFNDLYGHEAGDIVLREFATFLRDTVRTEDVACRYGGEEFIILMPGADLEIARERAEQIRSGAPELSLVHNGKAVPKVRVSVGVAVSPLHGDNVEALIGAADAALYTAKRDGRDRVRLAKPVNGTGALRDRKRVNQRP